MTELDAWHAYSTRVEKLRISQEAKEDCNKAAEELESVYASLPIRSNAVVRGFAPTSWIKKNPYDFLTYMVHFVFLNANIDILENYTVSVHCAEKQVPALRGIRERFGRQADVSTLNSTAIPFSYSEVFAQICSDAESAVACGTYVDYAETYGLGVDSIAGRETYDRLLDNHRKLVRALGRHLVNLLSEYSSCL